MSKAAILETPKRWPDGYFTVQDGTRLHYVEAGAGCPVILIHGVRGSAVGNWFSNGIAPRLAETNKVYALDMRGHGLSGAAQGETIDHGRMAADILEFMDQQGIAKAHLGGFSMGAFVLVELLMTAQERFITCCLQGGGIRETPEWRDRVPPDKEGRDPEQDKAEEIVRRRREAKGAEIGNNVSNGPPWPEGKRPPEFEKRMRAREERISAFDLSTIKIPVMAINGEYDRPRAMTHRLWRELDDFTNLLLPGKGHLTSTMAGFIPQAYIDGFAQFVVSHNPKP